jgi:hypothetical protein
MYGGHSTSRFILRLRPVDSRYASIAKIRMPEDDSDREKSICLTPAIPFTLNTHRLRGHYAALVGPSDLLHDFLGKC